MISIALWFAVLPSLAFLFVRWPNVILLYIFRNIDQFRFWLLKYVLSSWIPSVHRSCSCKIACLRGLASLALFLVLDLAGVVLGAILWQGIEVHRQRCGSRDRWQTTSVFVDPAHTFGVLLLKQCQILSSAFCMFNLGHDLPVLW